MALAVFAAWPLVGLWLVVGQARPLNLLALGEEGAQQLGVDAERLKRRVFAGAALADVRGGGLRRAHRLRRADRAAGASGCSAGRTTAWSIPTAVLGGGAFLLLADTLARNVVAPAELPVGVITAFCGAPFFVYLLRARAPEVGP